MKIFKNISKINFCRKSQFFTKKLSLNQQLRSIFSVIIGLKTFCTDDSFINNFKKHQFNINQIQEVLNLCNLEPKFEGNDKLRVKYCPLCPKPHNNDPSNFNTLLIYNKGIYQCYRCGNRGNFTYLYKILKRKYDIQVGLNSSGRESSNENSDGEAFMKMKNNNVIEEMVENESSPITHNNSITNSNDITSFPLQKRNKNLPEDVVISHISSNISSKEHKNHDLYKVSIANTSLLSEMYRRIILTENEKCQLIIDYLLEERKLNKETLKLYKVGVSYEKFKNNNYEYINLPCVSFPMFYSSDKSIYLNIDKDLVDKTIYEFFNCDMFYMPRIKVRAIGKEFKHFMRIDPAGAVLWGLFGINTVPKDAKEIIITEGEYDAMAAWQELKIPAVSLPNGATSLPVQLLPYFERFERIYLWMDADQAGKIASENFSKKLGEHKTLIVNTRRFDPNGPKDANDALKASKNLKEYIDQAKPLSGDNIIKLSDIKLDVLQYLTQYETYSGYKSLSFDFFNKKVKGLRMGEFDILTGETGSGKTTFLTQMSLDFLVQRVPTLWGSFEIKNDKLVSLFLMQYAKKNLRQCKKEEIEYYMEYFEKLPLYLLKFHGSSGINEIINTMEYAVYHYDIQNIVLDNLQFMIGMQARNTNKFDFQDEIIHRLRKFTSDKNVHVTLVIHPRKSDESLKISSIFGSAKASQEADNVYILQGYKGLRIVDVAKNRFDGTTGKTVLSFDQSNCRFFELTEKEFSDFSKNDKKIETIIEERIKAFGTIEKDSSLLYASDIASNNAESNDKNDTPKVTVTEEKVDEINSVNLETQAQTEENIKEERFVGDTISKEIISENNIIPLTNESTQDNDSLVVQITSALDLIENITKKEDVIDRIISEVNNTEEQQEIKLETKEEVIDSKENFNEKSEKNNKNEETSQITARVEENMKEVLEELKLHESSKEESELFNEKPLENKNLDNNEENNKETPEENFSQILEMSRSILPETKEIATLHTNDSKDKSQQLSYIYRINKKENFSQRYNNNYNNQHNDKQNNQYNSANFKSNNKQTKNRYNTDDFF